MTLLLLLTIAPLVSLCDSFCQVHSARINPHPSTSGRQSIVSLAVGGRDDETLRVPDSANSRGLKVAQLLGLVEGNESGENNQAIRDCIDSLDEGESLSENPDMVPLLGYYNVSSIIPVKDTDRPVGGKWNAFELQESYQHLLPPNEDQAASSIAQVINLVTFRVLTWTVKVLLRGDAYLLPLKEREDIVAKNKATDEENSRTNVLSPRTVRANFDPPRIFFGKRIGFSIGPASSVVLDTPFCDDCIRIGKGSRGTLFVFQRTAADDSVLRLLKRRLVPRRTLVSSFGAISGFCLLASIQIRRFRLLLFPISLLAGLCTVALALSTGGIVEDSKPSSTAA